MMLIETKGLILIEPAYQENDGGNLTQLFYEKAQNPQIIDHPLSAVVHQLKKQAHSHFIYTKEQLEVWAGCQHCLPIPVDFDTTLFPLQTRTAPQNEHDGCNAYINVAIINHSPLRPDQTHNREKVTLTLPNGVRYPAEATYETLWHHVVSANNVHNTLMLKDWQRLSHIRSRLQQELQVQQEQHTLILKPLHGQTGFRAARRRE